jgi:hypothetical protein
MICTAEDSAVFQIVDRFVDLLERVSPRHQLIYFSLPSRYQRTNNRKSRSGRQSPPLVRVKLRLGT